VTVAVRVRPFTSQELDQGARRVVSFNGNKLIIVNPTAFDADPDAIAVAAAAAQAKEWAQVR
jgi:tRNA C32,U32 (ribose-2'-O)-methylase TrmJ